MQIKRFEAQNMAEAFRMIKMEFGPEAVILSARHVQKETGLFGVTRNIGVEVTAAIDTAHPSIGRSAVQSKSSAVKEAGFIRTPLYWSGTPENTQSGVVSTISNRGRQLSQRKSPLKPRPKQDPPSAVSAAAFKKESDESADSFGDALIEETHLIADPLPPRKQSISATARKPERRQDEQQVIRMLGAHGVDPSLGAELLKEVQRLQSAWPALAKTPMADLFLKIIEAKGFSGEMLKDDREGRIQVFVGPAGEGKSTVLSKLAVKAVTEQKKRVGIITLDDGRMGAVYQLKVFAKILNVPVILASDPSRFAAAVDKMRNMDCIFVDTPGVGGKDLERLKQIGSCLETVPPNTLYLVLSAVHSAQDLNLQVQRFLTMKPSAFIFTKFDETSRWGGAFSQVVRHRLPIAYVTAGQEIPEDIGRMEFHEVVARVLTRPADRPVMKLEGASVVHGDSVRRYGYY
jgi:flagellar biosynthesis protein FlhF